jgi:deoxyuridine 5'-triphosphate nucleotidohydrolase family protein
MNHLNWRWATAKEQANNSRKCHMIEYRGKTHSLTEWSEILGLSFHLLSNRINSYKWSIEKAFETPKSNRGRKKK